MTSDITAGTTLDRAGDLVARAIGGDRRALARIISLIESDPARGPLLVERLYPRTGRAHRIGVTGPPGAGKSSLVARLIAAFRATARRVAVIAVDPSSPLTGGATLGDRIRLMDHHADPDVFIRSMASRGHRGGLAAATTAVAHALDAAGYDPILIETLGVGQDETEVARFVQTTLVIQVPGLGDAVQTLKAGLLELADILVVNKSDLEGSDRVIRDLATMLTLGERSDTWMPPIVRTSAATGEGIDDLIGRIEEHRATGDGAGELGNRQREIAHAEIEVALDRLIADRVRRQLSDPRWTDLVAAVAARHCTPAAAAERMLGEAIRTES